MAKIMAMLFSKTKFDTNNAKNYWAALKDKDDEDEVDRKRCTGNKMWNDIWGIDPAEIDADLLQKHNILSGVNVNN